MRFDSSNSYTRPNARATEIQKVLREGYKEVTIANVARLTREDKQELSPAQVRELQRSRLTPAERDELRQVKEQALERQTIQESNTPGAYRIPSHT